MNNKEFLQTIVPLKLKSWRLKARQFTKMTLIFVWASGWGASQQRAIQITSWFMPSPGVESTCVSLQLNLRYCQITFMKKRMNMKRIIVKVCYKHNATRLLKQFLKKNRLNLISYYNPIIELLKRMTHMKHDDPMAYTINIINFLNINVWLRNQYIVL